MCLSINFEPRQSGMLLREEFRVNDIDLPSIILIIKADLFSIAYVDYLVSL